MRNKCTYWGGQSLNKKAFTLIELLAVIVILAIIALIATPIILNIIDDSKREAAKVSAQNYFDSVELAISKEYVKNPNANLDGTYTISQDGKILTNTNGDKILKVEYEGNSELKIEENNSTITIEKGQVVSVGNIRVGNLYVTADSGKIIISDKLFISTLTTGTDFNMLIKKLSNGTDMYFMLSDNNVLSISFYSNGALPKDHTLGSLEQLKSIDVSNNKDNSIVAYYDNGKVYIYSKNLISFNKDSNSLFRQFNNLENINFNKVETTNVENFSSVFSGCNNLTTIDLENLDTSNTTNMSGLFSSCNKLNNLDLSKINTSKVENMSWMFAYYSKEVPLDLSNLNTSSVTDMGFMFFAYNSKVALDVSNLKIDKVTNMSNMFYDYEGPSVLDLSTWNTSKVTNMSNMFADSSTLTSIIVNKNTWITDNANTEGMFADSQAQLTYAQ